MTLAYFPMFPTDFDADTGHLSFAEDGAYNRLLRLSWRCPEAKMPDDLDWICRKARAVTSEDRALIEAVLAEFFTREKGKVFSRRLRDEWVKANDAHQRRVSAGSEGGAAKARKTKETRPSNATEMLEQCSSNHNQNQNHKEQQPREGENQAPTAREKLLSAMGADPISGLIGPNGRRLGTVADTTEAGKWSAMGLTLDQQCAVIAERCAAMRRKDQHWTPGRFAYFTGAMADLAAAKAAPTPTGTARPQSDRDAKLARYAKIAGQRTP